MVQLGPRITISTDPARRTERPFIRNAPEALGVCWRVERRVSFLVRRYFSRSFVNPSARKICKHVRLAAISGRLSLPIPFSIKPRIKPNSLNSNLVSRRRQLIMQIKQTPEAAASRRPSGCGAIKIIPIRPRPTVGC